MFLEISQNSQENTCARGEFCEISKNTFSYRTSLVTASEFSVQLSTNCHWYLGDNSLVHEIRVMLIAAVEPDVNATYYAQHPALCK